MPFRTITALCTLLLALAVSMSGQQASSTKISISPKASVIPAKTPITLTAAVSFGSAPVGHGVVRFCNASAKSCTGSALLATAQLNANGSAVAHVVLPPADYSVKAEFDGTPRRQPAVPPSQSDAVQFQVAAPTAIQAQ